MNDNEITSDSEVKKTDEFDYSYSSPDSEEKRWIESIRREYLPQEEHDAKVAEIKKLHNKAKKVPSAIAICIGIIGALILGLGMTLTLEWDQMIAGIIVGLIGMAIIFLAYPLYQFMKTRGKNKYGARIINLIEEIIKKKEGQKNEKEEK